MDSPKVCLELNERRRSTTLDKLRALARERLLADAAVVWIDGKRYLFGEISDRLLAQEDAPSALPPSLATNDDASFDPFAQTPKFAPGERLRPSVLERSQTRRKFSFPKIDAKLVAPLVVLGIVLFCGFNVLLGFLYFSNARKNVEGYELGTEIDLSGELSVPFRDDAGRLPKRFYGHDAAKVCAALLEKEKSRSTEKGEFETTEEYARRLASRNLSFRSSNLYDSIAVDSRLAFSVEPFVPATNGKNNDGSQSSNVDALNAVALDSRYDADSRTLELFQVALPAPTPTDVEGERRAFIAISRHRKVIANAKRDQQIDADYFGIALDCKDAAFPFDGEGAVLSWILTDVPVRVAEKMKGKWGALCVCSIADVLDGSRLLFQGNADARSEAVAPQDDLDKIVGKVEALSKLSPLRQSVDGGKEKNKNSSDPPKIGNRRSFFFAVQNVEFWLFDYESGKIFTKFSLDETLGKAPRSWETLDARSEVETSNPNNTSQNEIDANNNEVKPSDRT